MFARPRLVAFVVAAFPAALSAQGFEYAPGTQQYRIIQVTKISQEAMGQKQEMETSGFQLLTMALARQTKDTIAMTVVLDSISQTSPMGSTTVDRLKGIKLDAKLSPSGVTYSTSTKDSTIAGATELAAAAGRFLPRIRGRLAVGSSWMDTVAGKVNQQGLMVDRRTISRFAVVGDTTVAGEKTFKVSRQDSTTMSGSGTTQGQAITMEGTANGQGTLFVSPRGALLGGVGTEQVDMKIVLSANGMEVRVVQNANTKVEKVK